MPPASKRRRTTSGGPATTSSNAASAKAAQSTLSFRSSKAGARLTDTKKTNSQKPSITSHQKPLTADITDLEDKEVTTTEEKDDVTHTPSTKLDDAAAKTFQEVESAEEAEAEEEEEEDDAEAQLNTKALGLSEAKIKTYWMDKEKGRKAPRVHQKGLSIREKVLREFDMSSRYGPSIGITRLARWRRAQNMGTNPPIEVLAVLLKEDQIKGKSDGANAAHQTSIIDDLIMSSRMRDGSLAEA